MVKGRAGVSREAIQVSTAESREEWDGFVTGRTEANFLQSWDFYEFHKARGKKVVRRIFRRDEEIVGVYAGVVETAKRGRYLAIAGGPLLDWSDKKLIEAVFRDIREQGEKNECVFVRVRPQLELSDKSLELMRRLGLKPAPMYLSVEYAGILDLEKSEAEILAGASQGFRRKLRKAEKAGIMVEASSDPEIVKTFYELEVKHASRQGFIAFSEDYLKKQFETFEKNDEVLMYTARKDGEILAQNFMIFYGPEVSYHYGVSSDLGTKYSAAPLLHLKAMEEGRKRGCIRYNLWGIVGLEEKSHRFYGVSEFKRSFGCSELKYTPAHDLVLRRGRYLVTKVVETARKKVRHL
ncbi:MAG: peptidoglycan bridge formation glycyltransferase FemA/FemB family protein [Candidatus Saccharibacteria bacterium]|nr:peptidoglycan bridge formation glycyltransferase FemA/FemB family protein [Candidatus Saccharibacteria bacterium]